MSADIARFTYDPTRQYRSVIRQQGRVTLEADANEGAILASETLRVETIDLVGPAAAVGSGYAVSASGNTLTIGAGVFYLGGWRLELDAPMSVDDQPDWLDQPAAPAATTMVVALLLTEQSVCAVEDHALREVALGGPDSAARSRLMQHFLQIPMTGSSCQDAASTVNQLLSSDGVSLSPADQILSQATLLAAFVPGPPSSDPCTPAAAGGYLGADNQMIRVTVTAYDPNKRAGTLLWGWNNASFLYRCAMASDPYTLTLTDVPVDEEHAPQLGQWVEILRAEADLEDNNYIADSQGFITYLAQGYSFDTGEIVLNDPLPADYQGNKAPLFVRLWQAAVPFVPGRATPLDDVSGITVSISLAALPTQIAARPFWHFSVRPATPQAIYPARYLETPQPPDGPRQWITDLAVVSAPAGGGWTVIDDCRTPLGPQSQDCDCCGFVLGPAQVIARGGLQQVINTLCVNGAPARLSLKAGTYLLPQTLVFTPQHAHLIVEGCTSGVVITADPKRIPNFATGLVDLVDVEDLILRNLTFTPPLVPIRGAAEGAITIAAVVVTGADGLQIENCTFNMVLKGKPAFGGGVLVLGRTEQVTLRGNTFVTQAARQAPIFGVLGWVSGNNASAAVDNWEIIDNRFTSLLAAITMFAQLGLIRCSDNVITDCGSGIIFAEASLGGTAELAQQVQKQAARLNPDVARAAGMVLRPDLLANIISLGAPLVAALSPTPVSGLSSAGRQAITRQLSERASSAYAALAAGYSPTRQARKQGRSAAARKSAVSRKLDLTEFNKATIIAEAFEQPLLPALRIENNEISLITEFFNHWIGIGVLYSLPQDGEASTSTALISGNRVTTPDSTIAACGVAFPRGAVINGNILVQQARTQANYASLIVISLSPLLQISANLVQFNEVIIPPRTAPAPTPSWEFFNTVD